jgi:type II secretory pathway pseudopilin PulG
MKTSRRHARAFTLIEALAAIIVMVIVLPILLQGFTISGNVASITRQTADATLLAQSTLDDLVSNGSWQSGNSPGNVAVAQTTYSVDVETDTWDNELNVSQVTVKVHWTNHGAREVALTTVVYAPTDESGSVVSPGALP